MAKVKNKKVTVSIVVTAPADVSEAKIVKAINAALVKGDSSLLDDMLDSGIKLAGAKLVPVAAPAAAADAPGDA